MIDVITHPVFLWVVGSLLVSGLLLWEISYGVASYCVYVQTLSRRSKDQWARDIPSALDEETVQMYTQGVQWAKSNADRKQDVHIQRDGMNLYGEYYDFGFNRCAMILSGRSEGLQYGYYFAIPYAAYGYNILVVDPRAHGWSDGTYNTVGFEESLDDLEWVRFLQEEKGIRSVVFHGICIGAAGGMYAITHENCPKIVDAIVTEGMFPRFSESMKNHLIERKKPVFLFLGCIDAWMKKYTGHSMKFGPIDVIDRLEKPLLMLHSRLDVYSTPEYAQKLYDKAGAKKKRLVWFDKGAHSMVRVNNTEQYDEAITQFLSELDDLKNNE